MLVYPDIPVKHNQNLLSADELTYHVEACALNKRESQKVLYSSFYGYAMAICDRYANKQEDAVEILNDGFLKIFKETVFNLFVIEGLSHEEIANHLGVSIGTSKSNLSKARKHLQKILFKQNETLIAKNAV